MVGNASEKIARIILGHSPNLWSILMDSNPLPPAYESTVLSPVLLGVCQQVLIGGNRVSLFDLSAYILAILQYYNN